MGHDQGFQLLEIAYAEEFGKTGHALAGHNVIQEADVASVIEKGQGSSLLYGELLPAGVVQLNAALFSQRTDAEGLVLELGMGTGKVALQFFLSSMLHDVYGVELAPSRWALADAALKRVAAADPSKFQYESLSASNSRLTNLESRRTCEIVCGSLLDTPSHLLASACAVVMEVCLPREVQILACGILQHCPTGCRVVCYAPLHGLVEKCRLCPVRCVESGNSDFDAKAIGDGMGGLCLSASWKPHGHGFAFYELGESADAAASAWNAVGLSNSATVEVDASGNPSRGRKMRHTDTVLDSPRQTYAWGKGDKVLVGWSWLPFLDLGNPCEESTGLDGVTWMAAQVVSVDPAGFATICYEDDGTVEEHVHPERIRKKGFIEERELPTIDWGDDADFEADYNASQH